MVKGDAIHAYLGYNTAIQQQHMRIASVIKEIPGKSSAAVYFTHRINKTILCKINNDVGHISEVLNSLDGRIKIRIDPILSRHSTKIHFPMECIS
jgi:hypothetical protein